ncbi:ribonuclease E inhibitor RraB [Parashewanella curva]|uniref:Ribonuclease E inhibitor RraB n=1 Tax=Parashewanella curva TaxID=2338552 RepID=A0A3L8PX24_9GAMM|nr:ribonuclease E inhibitor RraB [Parashewanella curva]RLV59936.1 ribonuclease E inhibitor RraB [Parashewanella curva]
MSEISKETLEAFFAETREFTQQAEANFNIDEVCRWSYFFGDTSEQKLTNLGSHLESEGYEPIGFIEAAADDENPDLIYLRVDMEEKHSVESLHMRNQEFFALVKEYDIEAYEGMDVGPIDEVTAE